MSEEYENKVGEQTVKEFPAETATMEMTNTPCLLLYKQTAPTVQLLKILGDSEYFR
jgi:hypothetical protein